MELLINGEPTDLAPGTVLAVTVQSNDITKPDTVQSSYSNSLTLPFTERNHRILGNANQVSSQSAIPYSKLDCQVLQDGVEVLPLPKAYLTQASDGYELDVFSGAIDFFERLGDKSIQDLDLSRFDHTWSYQGVSDAPYVQEEQPGYIYELAHRGKVLRAAAIHPKDLYPSVYAKTVFEQLLSEAGVNYTGFVSEEFDRLLLPYSNGQPRHTTTWQEQYKGEKTLQADGTFAGSIPLAIGTLEVTYKAHIARYLILGKIYLELRRGAVTIDRQELELTEAGDIELQATFTIDEDPANLTLYIGYSNIEGPADPGLGGAFPKSWMDSATVTTSYKGELLYGSLWEVARNLPDLKQKDFFKSILRLYNLSVQYDAYSNTLHLVPFARLEENIQAGNVLDWSDKLVSVKDNTPIQYRFGDFAQQSWFRYEEDTVSGDAFIAVNDTQLDSETDVVQLPFAASATFAGMLSMPMLKEVYHEPTGFISDVETIAERDSLSSVVTQPGHRTLVRKAYADDPNVSIGWGIYKYLSDDTWELLSQQVSYDYEELKPRISVQGESVSCCLYDGTNTSYPSFFVSSFTPLHWEQRLPLYYNTLQRILDKAKGPTPDLLLNVQDVQGYDPSVPVWLSQYQSYFYLNAIEEYTGQGPTTCQLWRL